MMDTTRATLLPLKTNGDCRGELVVLEGNADIPFAIARIFYMYGMQGDTVRGQHANKRSEFVMINLRGQAKIKLVYADGFQEVVELFEPDKALYIPRMVWKDMYDFSEDSVLLVLSNERYDAKEYIRDLDGFLAGNFSNREVVFNENRF